MKNYFTFIDQIIQRNKSIIINSSMNLKSLKFNLKDLKSRLYSFLEIKIGLPTDDLIRVIILKTFSDKQVHLSNKI